MRYICLKIKTRLRACLKSSLDKNSIKPQYSWSLKSVLQCLKSDSHLPKSFFIICFNDGPLKMMKSPFYFILKPLFVLKIFKFLSWLFGHVESLIKKVRNGLIRKVRLIWKFLTSLPGWQQITIHILLNISRIKNNQTMKFGKLIEYPKRNIFLLKICRKWDRGTSPSPLFVFFKSVILGKSKCSAAWFLYIFIVLKLAYNRNNLFKTLHFRSRDVLNFDILDKGLGIVSPADFMYDFSTKMFLILYCINWPNFIVWLPLLLEILNNMCIAIVC